VTATDHERIQGLLAEGWRLLEAGDAREAALVFGRVAMVEPARAEAIRGLASARRAITESERRSDERLDEARRALENGDFAAARAGLEAVIADGGDRDHAAVLLDRLDERGGRLERAQPRPADSAPGSILRPSPVSWSRRAFAAASTIVLVALGAGVFSTWDRLLFGLTRPPAPRPSGVAAWPEAGRGGDRALAEARRLMEKGDAAAAVAALDRVAPEEPAYPFARQLRQQAELALREDPPRLQHTGVRR
jgi:nitroreductase